MERLGHSSSGVGDKLGVAKKIRDFQSEIADVKNHLKEEDYFKEVSR